jgi:hypothetical protein
LLDADGNPKTLRYRFAVVYFDDISAGENALEELYELLEALLIRCFCWKAGIQIKAGKMKFGVRSITFPTIWSRNMATSLRKPTYVPYGT